MENAGVLIVMLAVFGGIFYFLLIRPQRKKQKQHEDLVKSLQKGDEIITAGGIHGSVTKVLEEDLIIKIEDGTLMKVQQDSVVETKSDSDKNVGKEDSS
ncbi:MAG: preprotein translocase subunit YajC [Candidatus Bipolaricaulota bacterium]